MRRLLRTVLPGPALVLAAVAENSLWGKAGLGLGQLFVTAVPAGVAVCLRHRYPTLSLFVVVAVVMGQALTTPSERTTPILLTCLAALALMACHAGYAGVTRRAPRWPPAALAAVTAAVSTGTAVAVAASPDSLVFGAAMCALFGLVPALLGRDRGRQRELVRASRAQVAQLEREQRVVAQRTRLRERARIAQDMHDSLGHELSLIALRVAALEVSPEVDEPRRAVFGELRAAVTAATERLADIVGVLADDTETDDAETDDTETDDVDGDGTGVDVGAGAAASAHDTAHDPAYGAADGTAYGAARGPGRDPAHGDVRRLVGRARASGMRIDLRVGGERHRPPDAVERAAYRVLQEALTNAAKHAPGAAVTVDIDHSAAETVVTVRNERPAAGRSDVRGRGSGGVPGGGRRGLTGLRERSLLLGGTLEAGERDGAYQVTARLPHTGPARAPHGAEAEPPYAGPGEGTP